MEINEQFEGLEEDLIRKEIEIDPFKISKRYTFKSSKDIVYCLKFDDPWSNGYFKTILLTPGVKISHRILNPGKENSPYDTILSFPQDGLYIFQFTLAGEQFLYDFVISDSNSKNNSRNNRSQSRNNSRNNRSHCIIV